MPATKKFNTLEIILLSIIGILICGILVGTLFGLQNRNETEPKVVISKDGAVSLNAPNPNAEEAYYNLGTIRVVTRPDSSNPDDTGTAMVISPWIAYPEGDTVFYEEIVRKKGVLRGYFTAYFSDKTKKQLLNTSESVITKYLQEQLNTQLSLGKISNIYFTEYIFLD